MSNAHESRLGRRTLLTSSLSAVGLAALGAAGCAKQSSGASRATDATSAQGGGAASASLVDAAPASSGTAITAAASQPTLSQLKAHTPAKFTHTTWKDPVTGRVLPYNVFVPKARGKHPMVVYIADSGLAGKSVTAPLGEYGALIWAYDQEQARHPSVVVVPEFPVDILDDRGGRTFTPWVELTARFVAAMQKKYAVDTKRVYATGQSMGAMCFLYLAAQHPKLFAAELFVAGEWQLSKLAGLTSQKFVYCVAEGDPEGNAGQHQVINMFRRRKVAFNAWRINPAERTTKVYSDIHRMLANGRHANFITYPKGAVMKANPGFASEHHASFATTYRLQPLRDWLFAQHR